MFAIPWQQFQYFILFLTQQYKINSLLGFRGSNGYAKTPDVFRSVEISYPLLYRLRPSAKWLEVFSSAALRPHSESWPPLRGLRDHTLWTHTTR